MAALAATGVPLVTFDDRGEGRRHASAIINILVTEPDPASLPAGVRLFEGGPYVVADPLVVRTARRIEERDLRHARRAFVTMGGADAAGLTVKVACALHLVPELEMVEFASGPAFPHREELEEVLRDAPWESRVLGGMPTLAERYLAADVAVVAGGLTMYEVCLIGTPAVAVAQPIDHQFELAARLQAAGAQLSAGWGLDATVEDIARAVRRLVEDEALRRSMSAAGRALVDGRGTERVCDVLLSAASASRRETA
jgi:spore coat polysaccharide biosynthesis predicted glycosyltransferase SpsG